MKNILVLVEGETEKKLVNSLNIVGKIQIINLWEKPVVKIIPRIKEQLVLIVFDTDILKNIELFKKNLQTLQQYRVNFYLLQQTNNLEDELITCSNCRKIQEVFSTQGVKEFKSQWLKCQNLDKKLLDINFQPNQLWTRDIILPLEAWKNNKKSFKDLSLK